MFFLADKYLGEKTIAAHLAPVEDRRDKLLVKKSKLNTMRLWQMLDR